MNATANDPAPLRERFVAWVLSSMANRTDAYGKYLDGGKAINEKETLTADVVGRHFDGGPIVGVHAVSRNQTSLWVALDFDNHREDPDQAAGNLEAATAVYGRLRELGAEPIFEDSDGQGGYHILVVFETPVPAAAAHDWIRSIAPEAHEHFPKQRFVEADGFGNWLRIPGRHPRREHHSRIWNGGGWTEWPDCVELLVDAPKCPVTLVPDSPGAGPPADGRGIGSHVSNPDDILVALECLQKVDPSVSDQYESWIRVGMALHHVDSGPSMLAAWDAWSQRSAKYKPGECALKWRTFDLPSTRPVTLGTLLFFAGGDVRAHVESRRRARDPSGKSKPTPAERADLLLWIGEQIGRPVRRFLKHEGENPVYTLSLDDPPEEIQLGGAANVLSFRRFASRMFDRGVAVPPELGLKEKWAEFTETLLLVVEVLTNPAGTREARVNGWLEAYLSKSTIAAGENWRECIAANHPCVQGGDLCVHGPTVRRWVARRLEEKPVIQGLYDDLRYVGFVHRSLSHASWGTSRSYWCLPLEEAVHRWPSITGRFSKTKE